MNKENEYISLEREERINQIVHKMMGEMETHGLDYEYYDLSYGFVNEHTYKIKGHWEALPINTINNSTIERVIVINPTKSMVEQLQALQKHLSMIFSPTLNRFQIAENIDVLQDKIEIVKIQGIDITTFPEEIVNMSNLKELYIVGTEIKTIPNNINNLRKLKRVIIFRNPEITTPESMKAKVLVQDFPDDVMSMIRFE